ncbi:MAG: hypothetical protein HY270_18485 [Deltaproteobacteria bacterium]|nr:hypothetical protein [Deltaproteobacteria bacterium]
MTEAAISYEHRQLVPSVVFDLYDDFAHTLGTRGYRPRPFEPVTLRLTGKVVSGSLQPLDSPFEVELCRNAGGYHVAFDAIRLADGTRRRLFLEGTFSATIESPYYQDVRIDALKLPQVSISQPHEIALQPGYNYPFPSPSSRLTSDPTPKVVVGPTLIRGGFYATDGTGIVGARVEVPGKSNQYFTDASGQWVLVHVDIETAETALVRFVLPNGTTENISGVSLRPGGEVSVSQTALRGWVQNDKGLPIASATIEVVGFQGTSVSAADGGWKYFFALNQPTAAAGTIAVKITALGKSQLVPGIVPVPRSTTIVPTVRF